MKTDYPVIIAAVLSALFVWAVFAEYRIIELQKQSIQTSFTATNGCTRFNGRLQKAEGQLIVLDIYAKYLLKKKLKNEMAKSRTR